MPPSKSESRTNGKVEVNDNCGDLYREVIDLSSDVEGDNDLMAKNAEDNKKGLSSVPDQLSSSSNIKRKSDVYDMPETLSNGSSHCAKTCARCLSQSELHDRSSLHSDVTAHSRCDATQVDHGNENHVRHSMTPSIQKHERKKKGKRRKRRIASGGLSKVDKSTSVFPNTSADGFMESIRRCNGEMAAQQGRNARQVGKRSPLSSTIEWLQARQDQSRNPSDFGNRRKRKSAPPVPDEIADASDMMN